MQIAEFDLPRQEDIPNAAKELTPAKFAVWVQALPAANPVETAQQLLATLRKLARIRFKSAHRFALMDCLAPAAGPVFEALVQQQDREAQPLGDKHQNLAALLRQFHAESAIGYKLVVRDALAEGVKPKPRERELVHGLHRAIYHLNQELVAGYSGYVPERERIWGELHALYAYAEVHELHTVAVETAHEQYARLPSVSGAYKRAILLGLSNPYHLMRGEARQVFRLLADWAAGAVISPLRSEDMAEGPYVDLAADLPPAIPPLDRPAAPAEGRALDLAPVLAHLEGELGGLLHATGRGQAGPGGMAMADRLKRDLYLRLQRAWSARPDRRHARDQQLEEIELIMGLTASHHYVAGERLFTPEQDEARLQRRSATGTLQGVGLVPMEVQDWNAGGPEAPANRSSRFLADDPAEDVWYRVYATRAEEEAQTLHTQFAPTRWHQKDQSDGGLSLFSPDGHSRHMQVGEIVAYRTARGNQPGGWQVGAVRWMIYRRGTGLDLGIKTVAQAALAVGSRALRGTGTGSEYFRALLAPADDPLGAAATLVVPAAVYDLGTELVLNFGDRLAYVRLTRLRDASRSFHQFAFEAIPEPKNLRKPGRPEEFYRATP